MNNDWDGIAKYRYTDDDNGGAIFDATDEIHEELRELVESWRETAELAENDDRYNELYVSGMRGCANQLENLLND